jgi:hypothetical protein
VKRWTCYIRKRLLPVSILSIAAYAMAHGHAQAGNLLTSTINTVTNITAPVTNIIQPTINNIVPPQQIPTIASVPVSIPNLSNLGGLVSPGALQGGSIVGTTTNITTKLGKTVPALDLVGDGMTSIILDNDVLKATSHIPGNSVSIPASRFNDIMGKVVNLKGVHEARTASISKNGVIVLGGMGDSTAVDVSGQNDSIADATLNKANHLNKLLAEHKSNTDGSKSFNDLFDGFLDVKIINSDD